MPLRTLSFGFGVVLENPRFITCYDIFERKFILDAFKKVQAHIPSFFLLFVGEVFLQPALHKFSSCPIPRSECRGRFGDSNSTHYRSF